MAGPANARPPEPRARRRGVGRLARRPRLAGGRRAVARPRRRSPSSSTSRNRRRRRQNPQAAIEREAGQKQMLVQAREIDYDYTNHRVAAVGNVQIYYGGSTLEADKVIYDQTTKRLHAEGNVRLTEADGKITYGQIMDLSDDYRDGFVDSLRLDTPDQTRMAAARAERTAGNFTVFHSGVYTACAPCKDNPQKPPLWQVKAARIIHDQNEKMIYFEDARLEFFGTPLAWMPYFSTPDPTVKRKTGFLMPNVLVELEIRRRGSKSPTTGRWRRTTTRPFAPMITTKQGPLLQGEFRQRLLNGAYEIRAAGIRQLDKDYFRHDDGTPTPGYRDWRGSVESAGQFALNNKWVVGLGRAAAVRPDLPAGLQSASVALSHRRRLPDRRERGRLAALSRRQRQPQLFRRPLDLLSAASRKPTCKARFRSSIR